MKMAELCKILNEANTKIIYVIHDEGLQFPETLDLRRFADKLRSEGFIPLLAEDFRPHGKERVSDAIAESDITIILAFSESMVRDAEQRGVPFIEIEDFKKLVKNE